MSSDKNTFMSFLGVRLREARKFAGLSQSDVEGFTQTTIGRYERGKVMPGADAVAALADRFGVRAEWLLTGEGYKFKNRRTGPGLDERDATYADLRSALDQIAARFDPDGDNEELCAWLDTVNNAACALVYSEYGTDAPLSDDGLNAQRAAHLPSGAMRVLQAAVDLGIVTNPNELLQLAELVDADPIMSDVQIGAALGRFSGEYAEESIERPKASGESQEHDDSRTLEQNLKELSQTDDTDNPEGGESYRSHVPPSLVSRRVFDGRVKNNTGKKEPKKKQGT